MQRPRRLLDLLARLVGYPLFLPSSVFILLEIAVRLGMPQVLPRDAPEIYLPDLEIGWRHAASVRAQVNTGDRDVWICTDERGDRVSCSQPGPARCPRRILVIGDSFVEALALPFEETAWWRLQQDSGVCVDAAGVGAYYPGQYLELARQRLGASSPRYDLVILSFYSGNDVVDEAERIPPPRDVWSRPLRLLPEGLGARELIDWVYPLNQWLESRSHAYVALRFAIRRFRDPGEVGIDGVPRALQRSRLTPALVDEALRGVTLVAQEAHRAGAAFIVTVVPIPNQALDPGGEELRQALPDLADDIDMDLVSDLLVPRLRQLPGVEVVDLLPHLRRESPHQLWAGDGHLSSRGHQVWFTSLQGPARTALGLD